MSVKWCLIILIVISLVVNYAEYIFMYLLAICASSLGKCLCRSFVHFLIELLVFLLVSCKCSLYILSPSPDIWFTNILIHSLSCLFTFLCHLKHKTFKNGFWWNSIYFFILVLVLLVSYLRRLCLTQGYKYLLLYFLLRVIHIFSFSI